LLSAPSTQTGSSPIGRWRLTVSSDGSFKLTRWWSAIGRRSERWSTATGSTTRAECSRYSSVCVSRMKSCLSVRDCVMLRKCSLSGSNRGTTCSTPNCAHLGR
jgi:hypothetical protein